VRHFPDARPVSAEVEAVDEAIALTRRTGAPVYIIHLSSAAALTGAGRLALRGWRST
jgi:dihydroorotase-like cyclic amidohydrolase